MSCLDSFIENVAKDFQLTAANIEGLLRAGAAFETNPSTIEPTKILSSTEECVRSAAMRAYSYIQESFLLIIVSILITFFIVLIFIVFISSQFRGITLGPTYLVVVFAVLLYVQFYILYMLLINDREPVNTVEDYKICSTRLDNGLDTLEAESDLRINYTLCAY